MGKREKEKAKAQDNGEKSKSAAGLMCDKSGMGPKCIIHRTRLVGFSCCNKLVSLERSCNRQTAGSTIIQNPMICGLHVSCSLDDGV